MLKDLLEALKLGLFPATFGFFSEKIGARFDLWTAGNSTLFSAPSLIEILIIVALTGTAYRLLCQRPQKTKIPPASHQAEFLPVHAAMIESWLFYPGVPGSRTGKARNAKNIPVDLKSW